MRVMSYNTLFGGWDGHERRRLDLQLQVVAESQPDVLFLQECTNFHAAGHRKLFDLENALEMRGFLAVASLTGQDTAIFIRPDIEPVAVETDATHFHHAAIFLTVNVAGFQKPITFASLHLCPYGPHVRMTEASYLINLADPERLVVIGGDFNSVSPFDAEPVGWDALPPHQRTRYLGPDGQTADRQVLRRLHQAGFVDIAVQCNPQPDTTVPGAAFLDREFIPFRSDYLLSTPALAEKAVAFSVIKTEATGQASDHYPILAEFRP